MAHTTNLFQQLNILKIEDLFTLKQIIFYYKFIHNELPNSLKDILIRQEGDLRRCHTAYFLKPPACANTESAKLCIRYSVPALINNFNQTFIENLNSDSLFSIKEQYKAMTLAKYFHECTDINCYPCITRFFNPFGFSKSLKYLHLSFYMINFKYQKIFLPEGILTYLNIFNYCTDNFMRHSVFYQ